MIKTLVSWSPQNIPHSKLELFTRTTAYPCASRPSVFPSAWCTGGCGTPAGSKAASCQAAAVAAPFETGDETHCRPELKNNDKKQHSRSFEEVCLFMSGRPPSPRVTSW